MINIQFLPNIDRNRVDTSSFKTKWDELKDLKYDYVDCVVHCEMQLLQRFLSNAYLNIHKVFNYIGCNKAPCWLCWHTLKSVTNCFEMREPHLKVYARWWPPSFHGESGYRLSETLNGLLKHMNHCIMSSSESRPTMSDLGPLELRGHKTMYGHNKRRRGQDMSLLTTEELREMDLDADWGILARESMRPQHE